MPSTAVERGAANRYAGRPGPRPSRFGVGVDHAPGRLPQAVFCEIGTKSDKEVGGRNSGGISIDLAYRLLPLRRSAKRQVAIPVG